jgi:hypothetical protein
MNNFTPSGKEKINKEHLKLMSMQYKAIIEYSPRRSQQM